MKTNIYTYKFDIFTIYHLIVLRIKNFSNKSCRENQNTDFMFNTFFPKIVPFMR